MYQYYKFSYYTTSIFFCMNMKEHFTKEMNL